MQGLEVTLRNALDRELTREFGPAWYNAMSTNSVLKIEERKSIAKVRERIKKAGKAETHGRMVAELSFGFWVSLCARRFMELWIKTVRRAFKAQRLDRATVFGRLNGVRILRNRVAHHEPILNRNLEDDFNKIIQTVGWLCPITADWVQSTSCFRPSFSQ